MEERRKPEMASYRQVLGIKDELEKASTIIYRHYAETGEVPEEVQQLIDDTTDNIRLLLQSSVDSARDTGYAGA